MNVPRLETPRLVLRGPQVEDLDASAAMWSDPEIVRHISGTPSTREQSWGRLLRHAGHWALLGYGYWVVAERDTGAFVGEVGFADYRRDITPSLEGIPELGWALVRAAHGKGYATEAVRAAIAWAERSLGAAHTMACIITPENAASIRVAEKSGFSMTARTTYSGVPVLLYKRSTTTP